MTRTHAAEVSGLRAGPFGRWANGVTAMREDCIAFAAHWREHNDRVLAAGSAVGRARRFDRSGPRRAVPRRRVRRPGPAELRQSDRAAVAGAQLVGVRGAHQDVLRGQLPQLPAGPDIVTCGMGVNDILYTAPAKLFSDLRALIAVVPDQTVLLDLPVPAGMLGVVGRASVPYVTRINRTIHAGRPRRALPVAACPAISCLRGREVRAGPLPPEPGRPPRLVRAVLAAITGPQAPAQSERQGRGGTPGQLRTRAV